MPIDPNTARFLHELCNLSHRYQIVLDGRMSVRALVPPERFDGYAFHELSRKGEPAGSYGEVAVTISTERVVENLIRPAPAEGVTAPAPGGTDKGGS